MKSFFAVITNGIVCAGLKVYYFFKSLHLGAIAADILVSVKSFFSPSSSYDSLTAKKRIAIAASVVVLIAAVIAGKMLISSRGAGAGTIELKDPVRKDSEEVVWSLGLMKGQSAGMIAASGKKPGPPLLVKTEAQARERIVTVGVTVEGQAGEKYVPGVQKNGEWQPPPRYQLISEQGKIIGVGRFEYG